MLLNPDPAVRRSLRLLGIFAGVLAVLWMVGTDPRGPVQTWAQSVENREMRPAMESAMNAGNRVAGTWLTTHFRQDYPGLLQQEADAGEPTAMFIMGRILMNSAHPGRFVTLDRNLTASQVKGKGLDLVRKAAAAGNPDALLFVARHDGA
ncbi:hypothetical protein [Paraburkholderia sp. BL23I1N1]|uniref:hypothetical protein n=1 Tax=Paraburkholderia sp. BL23I1N1 TaxID=1938802 RepID=UPI00217D7B03|nr:hypothetical protein [Paraburkholderia sp. BL23I1N1]